MRLQQVKRISCFAETSYPALVAHNLTARHELHCNTSSGAIVRFQLMIWLTNLLLSASEDSSEHSSEVDCQFCFPDIVPFQQITGCDMIFWFSILLHVQLKLWPEEQKIKEFRATM